jgi:UDP-N-acetylmuramoylalanine--D-glutamate ligase
LASYEAAKASIWDHLDGSAVVVASADDPVVSTRARLLDRPVTFFSIGGLASGPADEPAADWFVDHIDGAPYLVGPDGPLLAVAQMARRQPHDLANALATAAIASAMGGTPQGIVGTLRSFQGLPHRLEPLGQWDQISWFNDSKATVPQATVAAVSGFDSVVLIAGGSGKGLSFAPLAGTVPPVRAVVAIGEAAAEVAAVFDGTVPVRMVTDGMEQAIEEAAEVAQPGDTVVLSPACASFDWYRNYVERGLAFSALVRARFGETAPSVEAR